MATAFQCSLVTPESELLDEPAVYASIPAHDGQLGVQHLRSPLLARLGYGKLRLDLESGGSKTFFISSGFAQIKDDKLVILTDQAIASEDIDASEAEAMLKNAQSMPGATPAEQGRKDREAAKARGMLASAK